MKRRPVWLQPRWERRKQETVSRVKAAVEILRQQAREVTFSNICAAVKELYGVPISSNTLKRDESAYQIYLAHRKPPKKGLNDNEDCRSYWRALPAWRRINSPPRFRGCGGKARTL